jgi:hypothetical protein
VKAALAGQQFPRPEDVLSDIQELLSEIQRSQLEFVFHHWIEGFNGCWITMETSSMITIRSSSAPIGWRHYLSIPMYHRGSV